MSGPKISCSFLAHHDRCFIKFNRPYILLLSERLIRIFKNGPLLGFVFLHQIWDFVCNSRSLNEGVCFPEWFCPCRLMKLLFVLCSEETCRWDHPRVKVSYILLKHCLRQSKVLMCSHISLDSNSLGLGWIQMPISNFKVLIRDLYCSFPSFNNRQIFLVIRIHC